MNEDKKATELLHKAVQKGDITQVIKIAASSENFNEERVAIRNFLERANPKSGDRALHLAARHGHVRVLEYLKEEGVDFESANLDGKRAIHEAAAMGHVECVDFLLQQGVLVDALKRADWTPLHLSCTKASLEVVQRLLQGGADSRLCNKDGWNAFHIASREGHREILALLLDHCNDLWDTVSKNGRTPLHTAALHGRFDAVELMLTRCAYPSDQTDSCGSSPLIDALRSGFMDVAQILLEKHKADVMKTDLLGRQAIHLVAQAGCLRPLEFLVKEHGVCVDSPTGSGKLTPLHLAAKEGQEEVMRHLVLLGANINATDDKGRTPLHIATGGQHGSCVKFLLQHGARLVKDHHGTHPRELARQSDILLLFDKM